VSKTSHLIDSYLSGQSAKYLIDSVVDELPSKNELQKSISNSLPKGTKFEFDESVVRIDGQDKSPDEYNSLMQEVHYLQAAYPELFFLIERE
jgi:hypothetical protein